MINRSPVTTSALSMFCEKARTFIGDENLEILKKIVIYAAVVSIDVKIPKNTDNFGSIC